MNKTVDSTLVPKINELIDHMHLARQESETINTIKNELSGELAVGTYYHVCNGQTWVLTVSKANPKDKTKAHGVTVSLKPATKIT